MSHGRSSTHYLTGEKIAAGDRVTLAGMPGRVKFVLSDLPGDDWFRATYGRGFMLDIEGMGSVLVCEADEDLTFTGRAGASGTQ